MSLQNRARRYYAVVTGAHAIIFTRDPEGARAFFRDVLSFASVDAGRGS